MFLNELSQSITVLKVILGCATLKGISCFLLHIWFGSTQSIYDHQGLQHCQANKTGEWDFLNFFLKQVTCEIAKSDKFPVWTLWSPWCLLREQPEAEASWSLTGKYASIVMRLLIYAAGCSPQAALPVPVNINIQVRTLKCLIRISF